MTDIGDAYAASVTAWAVGPDGLYARFARAALTRAPIRIAGMQVLDVGAGTGACTRELLAAGARRVVAADLAAGPLHRITSPAVARVVADAAALPFGPGVFDLVTAACMVGHLPDPGRFLAEARRVAPALLATAFRSGWSHPAKTAVDDAMREFGFVAPPWYVRIKTTTEPLVDHPDRLRALAAGAGWAEPSVGSIEVPSGLITSEQLVAWRLGMAHLAPFIGSLAPRARARAVAAAERAVAGLAEPVIPLLVLTAR